MSFEYIPVTVPYNTECDKESCTALDSQNAFKKSSLQYEYLAIK